MALIRSNTYAGRYEDPTPEQPQGAFKNRTTANSQDGSYLEAQWLNDWSALFSSMLQGGGIVANGQVDTVGASQYYAALQNVIQNKIDGNVVDASSWGGVLNKIPKIGNSGVMEIGRYIDMRTTDSGADYDIRIDCSSQDNLNIDGGSVNVSGGDLSERGERVYSPNNKPTAEDVDAVPLSGGDINGGVNIISNDGLSVTATSGTSSSHIWLRRLNGTAAGIVFASQSGGQSADPEINIRNYAPDGITVNNELSLEADKTISSRPIYENSNQRVYSTGNKPTTQDIGAVPASDISAGSSWSQIVNKIPKIGSSGVLEIGKFIDFHSENSTADYDFRFDCVGFGELLAIGDLDVRGSLKSSGVDVLLSSEIASSKNQNGWLNVNGLILQWQIVTIASSDVNKWRGFAFPIPFPNRVLNLQATMTTNDAGSGSSTSAVQFNSQQLSGKDRSAITASKAGSVLVYSVGY